MSDLSEYGYRPKKKKTAFWVILVILLLVVSNVATYFISSKTKAVSSLGINVDADDTVAIRNINKILYLIDELEENFLWEVDEDTLWDGALHGIFDATGDIYSEYMNAEEYAQYQESVSGSYSGIGVQITNNADGNVQITKVSKDTPAYEAGLQVGDVLSSADGQSLLNMTVSVAVTYVRGESGSVVTLGYIRNGVEYFVDVVRQTIPITYCEWKMLEGNIGYIYISEFESDTYDQFAKGIKELTADGAKGIILDLRQNPGGLVSQAVKIADEFLDKADVIYLEDNKGNRETYTAKNGSLGLPLVILIDENSASSSEILTLSLKENGVATIVGTQSFGKGIVQVLIPMADKTLYKYTYAQYFGPNGTAIHGVGITPDYVIEKKEGTENLAIEDIAYEEDYQLQKAVEIIKEQIRK